MRFFFIGALLGLLSPLHTHAQAKYLEANQVALSSATAFAFTSFEAFTDPELGKRKATYLLGSLSYSLPHIDVAFSYGTTLSKDHRADSVRTLGGSVAFYPIKQRPGTPFTIFAVFGLSKATGLRQTNVVSGGLGITHLFRATPALAVSPEVSVLRTFVLSRNAEPLSLGWTTSLGFVFGKHHLYLIEPGLIRQEGQISWVLSFGLSWRLR